MQNPLGASHLVRIKIMGVDDAFSPHGLFPRGMTRGLSLNLTLIRSILTRMSRRMSLAGRGQLAMIGLIAVLSLPGCTFKGAATNRGASSKAVDGVQWIVRPVKMRVFPTTRFNRSGDVILLQARVELFDVMSDSVKGVGQFSFDLYAVRGEKGSKTEKFLYNWTINVQTLKEQVLYYDPVMRGYHFPLELHKWPVGKEDLRIEVVFISADGKRINTQARLDPTIRSMDLPSRVQQ